MKENYLQAVLDMIKAGKDPEYILAGLKKLLVSKGHERLYPAVLRGVVRVLDSHGTNQPLVTLTTKEEYKKYQEAITKALEAIKAKDDPEIIIDETIVGGFIVEDKQLRIDASYKSKLIDLYRAITN